MRADRRRLGELVHHPVVADASLGEGEVLRHAPVLEVGERLLIGFKAEEYAKAFRKP